MLVFVLQLFPIFPFVVDILLTFAIRCHYIEKRGGFNMATARLTKRFIDSLGAPAEGYTIYWDEELGGLGLRIMTSGLKTYVLDYRDAHGRQHRIKIGRHGVITLFDARKLAKKILHGIAAGHDPVAEREEARRGAATFRTIAEEYIRLRCVEKKSGAEDERIIRRELLPYWGRKLASEIKRADVMRRVEEIKVRGSGVMANRTLARARCVFNWAIDRELVSANPAARIHPPAKETSRERILENEEIRAFWNALETLPGDLETRLALKLLLVTAQRPGEIAGLEWEDIGVEEKIWTIPAAKSKNDKPHRVPLSGLALEILAALRHRDTGPVFASPRDPERPITRAALAHLIYRGRKLLNMEPFTPHDLRRTSASKMASMGVSRLVISRILNHSERGVTAIYDRHSYDNEKRTALEAWDVKLRDIIEGSETMVLSLRRLG